MRIREALADDAERILAIYAPFVEHTAVTFETMVPRVDEMQTRVRDAVAPWLVAVIEDAIVGYAYAGPHRSRAAYVWSVEVSVYTSALARRQGVGRALYASLFELLRAQGFVNAYAGIALPNEASVGFHESLGFTSVGVYRHVGYKLGAWRDVGWWALTLVTPDDGARPPLSLDALRRSKAWRAMLAKQTSHAM
jgi:L-amino acid N-acyltransferase YncA